MAQIRGKGAQRTTKAGRGASKTPDVIIKARKAAAAELLKHGQAYLQLISDLDLASAEDRFDDAESDTDVPNEDEAVEPIDNEDLHDADYVDDETVDSEEAADAPDLSGKPWYLPDDPNGPYVFRVLTNEPGAPARCTHIPKAWMTDQNDVPEAADAKERVRTSLDKLATAIESRLPRFLNHPNARAFAADWAETIGASSEMMGLAKKVPWQAKTFVECVCPELGEERFSRVKDRVLLVWPHCQMPLSAFVSDAFKHDVADALFHDYINRFGWTKTVVQRGQERDKLNLDFDALSGDQRKSLAAGRVDGPTLRIVWEHFEGVTLH